MHTSMLASRAAQLGRLDWPDQQAELLNSSEAMLLNSSELIKLKIVESAKGGEGPGFAQPAGSRARSPLALCIPEAGTGLSDPRLAAAVPRLPLRRPSEREDAGAHRVGAQQTFRQAVDHEIRAAGPPATVRP